MSSYKIEAIFKDFICGRKEEEKKMLNVFDFADVKNMWGESNSN